MMTHIKVLHIKNKLQISPLEAKKKLLKHHLPDLPEDFVALFESKKEKFIAVVNELRKQPDRSGLTPAVYLKLTRNFEDIKDMLDLVEVTLGASRSEILPLQHQQMSVEYSRMFKAEKREKDQD